MSGQGLTAQHPTGSKREVCAAANLVVEGGYGSPILDREGRVPEGGKPAGNGFNSSPVRLAGRPVSDFIAGPNLGRAAPGDGAKYFPCLSADGGWRKFDAKNDAGRGFGIELGLSRRATEDGEVVILNVYGPEEQARVHGFKFGGMS